MLAEAQLVRERNLKLYGESILQSQTSCGERHHRKFPDTPSRLLVVPVAHCRPVTSYRFRSSNSSHSQHCQELYSL